MRIETCPADVHSIEAVPLAPVPIRATALCLMSEALGALPVRCGVRMAGLIQGAPPRGVRSALVTLVPWVAPWPCLARRCRALIAEIDDASDGAGLTSAALRLTTQAG